MESFSEMYCSAKSLGGVASTSSESSFLQDEKNSRFELKKISNKKLFLDIFFKISSKIQFS